LDKKYEVQKNKKGVKFFKMGKRIKKIFFNGEEYPPETFRLGMMLCMVGGFMDAYTFVTRGKVLANAQTGNVVYLAINLQRGDFGKAFNYFMPILVFTFGILFTEFIRVKFEKHRIFRWQQIVIFFQVIIMFFISFIPSGNWNIVVNMIMSFIAAIQYQGFRKIRGLAGATTMCTGNLRSGMENLFKYINTENKSYLQNFWIYLGLDGFFFVGAMLCVVLVKIYGIGALLACCILLVAVFIIMFKETI